MSEQSPSRARHVRFVTLCQQLLALAVVLAVLTPAARTITMDVRPMPLDGASSITTSLSAYVRASVSPSRVPTAPVAPKIATYALGATGGSAPAPRVTARRGASVLTRAVPVKDFGAVGVTWAPGQSVRWSSLSIKARTLTDGTWSGWTSLGKDDISPDAGTPEARKERPGTEALFVGRVDRAQVRVASTAGIPRGLSLSVIDPGQPTSTRLERPAIDTAALSGAAGDEQSLLRRTTTTSTTSTTSTLAASGVTPKPQIYSRAQWGADERLRDKASLHYGEVHAGFIHHTVQANNYTRGDVPALIRADYAYHTQTRGWSDIGYNYLIDRFGRIWEGRYGGVDRDPVGAHTLGYNDDSFAASAIGNFQVARPSAAMVQAYAALFAWKLSLAGVSADATHQWVEKSYENAINGHRDVGSTLCPGKYLYAKIPRIRQLATALQASWGERNLDSGIVGDSVDLMVRRAKDGEGMVLPIRVNSDGNPVMRKPIDTGIDLSTATRVLRVGDWDGDGIPDIVVRRSTAPANLYLYRGRGKGRFHAATLLSSAMSHVGSLTAVGDFNGDGHPDLVGQRGKGPLLLMRGKGANGVRKGYPIGSHVAGGKVFAAGRWDTDGAPDLLIRTSKTTMALLHGNGPGLIASREPFQLDPKHFQRLVVVRSVGGGSHNDLIVQGGGGLLWAYLGTAGTTIQKRIQIGDASAYDMIA